MSKISVRTRHMGELWLSDDNAHFTYNWGPHTLSFDQVGIAISTEVELTIEEKTDLVKCLTFKDPSHVPHWQTLTPNLHRTVERIVSQVRNAAITVDQCIRQSPKGVRLSPLSFEERFVNLSQSFPVVNWVFTNAEREELKSLYEDLPDNAKRVYDKGIRIPMPISFERRQIQLENSEVEEIGVRLQHKIVSQPFRTLYAIAWDNLIGRSFDSAVLILSTSIETALKWWLGENGDTISNFLISNMQSPPIEQLYSCARKNTELNLPVFLLNGL